MTCILVATMAVEPRSINKQVYFRCMLMRHVGMRVLMHPLNQTIV